MRTLRIFDFEDYKVYVRARIEASPNRGRGELTRISHATGAHKTTLSQVFKGDKELSLEQALKLARYLELNGAETEYFVLLVDAARAGSEDLKKHFEKQLADRREAHRKLINRVTRSRELSSEERSIYYSNWIYSAVRNLTAIEGMGTLPALARRLGLDLRYLEKIVVFLLATGLCVEKKGILSPGPQMTHLEAESPIVARHHGNWRIKAMEHHPVLNSDRELAYTAPMTLSVKDAARIQATLADVVAEVDRVVGPSPSEALYCLNLDWFEVV